MENYNNFYKENIVELLNCNKNNYFFSNDDKYHIFEECKLYYNSTLSNSNYPIDENNKLEQWISNEGLIYPNIHKHHRFILDIVKDLNPKNILDCGSGPGLVSKYIYYENRNIEITCVENNPVHYKQMLENFDTRSNILKPEINVNATKIKGNIIKLPFNDNKFEFVFSCTVLMHIPFYFAIASICEMAGYLINIYVM